MDKRTRRERFSKEQQEENGLFKLQPADAKSKEKVVQGEKILEKFRYLKSTPPAEDGKLDKEVNHKSIDMMEKLHKGIGKCYMMEGYVRESRERFIRQK